jgi:hypothetical protein
LVLAFFATLKLLGSWCPLAEFTDTDYNYMIGVARKQLCNPFGSHAVYHKYRSIVKLVRSSGYRKKRKAIALNWYHKQHEVSVVNYEESNPASESLVEFSFSTELRSRDPEPPKPMWRHDPTIISVFAEGVLVKPTDFYIRENLVLLDGKGGVNKPAELEKLAEEMLWLLLFYKHPMSRKQKEVFKEIPYEWAVGLVS